MLKVHQSKLKEVFPKIKDHRVDPQLPNRDHVLSFDFPSYPVIWQDGSELILSETEWSVYPVNRESPGRQA